MSGFTPQPPPPPMMGGAGAGQIVMDHPRAKTIMWLGLGGWCCSPLGIVALFMGFGALKEIRQSNGKLLGSGMVITGMVSGGVQIAILAFFVLLVLLGVLDGAT